MKKRGRKPKVQKAVDEYEAAGREQADAERLAPEDAERWRKRLGAEIDRLATKSELVNGRSFGVRLKAFRRLWPGFGFTIANYLRVAFLLPRPLSAAHIRSALRFQRNSMFPGPDCWP